MHEPRLDTYTDPAAPSVVLLLLHGGQERSVGEVRDRHASWWRMAAMARSLRDAADRHDAAVQLLQYRLRGWNEPADPAPVRDARWALDTIAARHPGTPVVIVGHSMGGRTACHVADHPSVLGVVGLAPWLPQGEPVTAIAGRHLHVMHGTRDRWTSARWSREYVERCQGIATEATWTSLPGVGHFMLRRVRAWNGFVEDSIERILSSRGEDAAGSSPSEGHA